MTTPWASTMTRRTYPRSAACSSRTGWIGVPRRRLAPASDPAGGIGRRGGEHSVDGRVIELCDHGVVSCFGDDPGTAEGLVEGTWVGDDVDGDVGGPGAISVGSGGAHHRDQGIEAPLAIGARQEVRRRPITVLAAACCDVRVELALDEPVEDLGDLLGEERVATTGADVERCRRRR